jgi:hypothetical protein
MSVHRSPLAVPILTQMYPCHTLLLGFILILSCHLRLDILPGVVPSPKGINEKQRAICGEVSWEQGDSSYIFCHVIRGPEEDSSSHPHEIRTRCHFTLKQGPYYYIATSVFNFAIPDRIKSSVEPREVAFLICESLECCIDFSRY